ncbi:MAG TPA: type II toxin-antitoxin system RelE/ParE family toxin [Pyrinomonadaceae bacterium]|nr:type II toxin-antitoxin system RelE/ParE family toxin [Pyrinomonadaceae bacterium]
MGYKVILSISARTDLRDIVRYISLDNPEAALRFGKSLISRTRLLEQSPQLERIAPELDDPSIREIIVRSCRVVYRVRHSEQVVEVIRFWPAARDVPDVNV